MTEKPFRQAVKGLIRDPRGRILFLRRSEDSKHFPGKWDLPGGKANRAESPEDSLRREALEETGLEVEIVGDLGLWHHEMDGGAAAIHLLDGRVGSDTVTLSTEHDAHVWATRSQIADLDLSAELAGLDRLV